jgi:predicted PurR-regulated permease PerM
VPYIIASIAFIIYNISVMSIHDIVEKIKSLYDNLKVALFFFLLVLIVGLISFYLGRLSTQEASESPNLGKKVTQNSNNLKAQSFIKETDTQTNNTTLKNTVNKTTGKYIASKNGKIYYPKDCKGSQRIKDSNRVFFETKEEAEYKGYKQTASCIYI